MKFVGGQSVGRGTYLNWKTNRVVEIASEGVLPGGPEDRFLRVPFPLLFLYVIGAGALFVVLLPVVSAVLFFYLLGKRVLGGVLSQARRGVAFGWRPQEAYLAGGERKRERKKESEANGTPGTGEPDRESNNP